LVLYTQRPKGDGTQQVPSSPELIKYRSLD
jgi:hypothetical protein